MLTVWRGRGTIFCECTSCGSYGTAPHLQFEKRVEPDIQEAIDKHTATMLALRSHFTKAASDINRQVKAGSLKRQPAMEQVRKLWENHVAQVRMAEASLPDPTGKVSEVVTACPWCKHPELEVEVQQLPDELREPAFTLAVKKTPVKEAANG